MILIFGADGQLGQEMTRIASNLGIVLTALTHADADIGDHSAIAAALMRHRPRLVINAAAYTKVDLAELEIEKAYRANATGPALLAKGCAALGLPLVQISTDYVFDGNKLGGYLENDPVCPISSYGCSKAAGEEAVRTLLDRHIILRTAWVYGEFGHNFLKTVVRLAATSNELRIVTDQRGSPTSTRDLAEAIFRITPRLLTSDDIWGTYHFTGTGVTTWHGFADRIVAAQAKLTGRRPYVIPISTSEFPTRARRPLNSELDCSLFRRTFGFQGRPWIEEVDLVTLAIVGRELGRPPHVT